MTSAKARLVEIFAYILGQYQQCVKKIISNLCLLATLVRLRCNNKRNQSWQRLIICTFVQINLYHVNMQNKKM